MAAIESSGTQTATLTSEHELAAPSTLKTRVLIVDIANMVNGETLTLQMKLKVLTGGTVRTVWKSVYKHDPGAAGSPEIVQSPPLVMPFGGSITLRQDGGTGRAYDWSILTLD
jgi:hypothetical protein